jgi:hypothetical protein
MKQDNDTRRATSAAEASLPTLPRNALVFGVSLTLFSAIWAPYCIWEGEARFSYRGHDYAFSMVDEPLEFWSVIAFFAFTAVCFGGCMVLYYRKNRNTAPR